MKQAKPFGGKQAPPFGSKSVSDKGKQAKDARIKVGGTPKAKFLGAESGGKEFQGAKKSSSGAANDSTNVSVANSPGNKTDVNTTGVFGAFKHGSGPGGGVSKHGVKN